MDANNNYVVMVTSVGLLSTDTEYCIVTFCATCWLCNIHNLPDNLPNEASAGEYGTSQALR